jgi:hypothetical protein
MSHRDYDRRRRVPKGLLDALRVVERLPRRSGQPDTPEESEAYARGYDHALWDARSAILREIEEGSPPDWLAKAAEFQALGDGTITDVDTTIARILDQEAT